MPRHVIISGVTSCQNRGVEALVRSILSGLAMIGPWRATVLTQTPRHDDALLRLMDAECVSDPFVVSRSLRESPREPEASLAARREQLLASADLLIATGGDIYTSDYGVSARYLAAPNAALDRGVPVAMLAHSVGPFSGTPDAVAWSATARQCTVLTVRESQSWRYVTRDLGLPEDRVALTADPAFLLQAAPDEEVDGILAGIGIQPGHPYACVAPSRGIAGFRGLSEDCHFAALRRLVRSLISWWRLPVVLIPHVHDARPGNDDRQIASDLALDLATDFVRTIPGPLGAMQYKGIVARSALMVAERMHAGIAALSSAVPTVTIGYSQKFAGVMGDTYGETVPLSRVHIAIESFTEDDGSAARLIERLPFDEMRAALTTRQPLIQNRAVASFTMIHGIPEGRP